MTPATLITIPVSHFCEKARWALDYAGVPFVEDAHVPLFHRVAIRRAGGRTHSVPFLASAASAASGREVLADDSTKILELADARASAERKLYPAGDEGREVRALEDDLDERLGPHLRRLLYFFLLPHRSLVLHVMDQRTPRWERAALRAGFPVLRAMMRRFMRIDAAGAARSRDHVLETFDAIEQRLASGRRYLVGDRFSAADLTFAALVAPAVRPPGHVVDFPPIEALAPEAAQLLRETQTRPIGAYVRRMYADHRRG